MILTCINDDFSKVIEELKREANNLSLYFPVKGEQYTLREEYDNDGLVKSYLLHELHNPTFFIPVLGIRRELSFAHWRFAITFTEASVEEYIDEIIYSN
jgi:hypothetical protein